MTNYGQKWLKEDGNGIKRNDLDTLGKLLKLNDLDLFLLIIIFITCNLPNLGQFHSYYTEKL
jgi:hypothetical protein